MLSCIDVLYRSSGSVENFFSLRCATRVPRTKQSTRLTKKNIKTMDNKQRKLMMETYYQYYRNIYNAVRNSPIFDKFQHHSLEGNRREMIELIIDLPQVRNMKIYDCFECKNNELAEKLLGQVSGSSNTESENNNIQLINKALLTATFQSKIYLQLMMERIRNWYKLKKFYECLIDIEYVTKRYNVENNFTDFYAECKIECYLLESELNKILHKSENAKNSLNKAMAELNNLARQMSTTEDNVKQLKHNLLQMFLQKLKKGKEDSDSKSISMVTSEKITIPKLYGQVNDILKCCTNSISLGYNEVRGRYLYATEDIPIGSTIIVDQPFSFSINQEVLHRNCLHCYTLLNLGNTIIIPCSHCQSVLFCSDKCFNAAWKQYHQYECSIFSLFSSDEHCHNLHLSLAYRTIVSKLFTGNKIINREWFDTEHVVELKRDSKMAVTDQYDPLDYRVVCNLQNHCSDLKPVENLAHAVKSIFFTKCINLVLKKETDVIFSQDEQISIAAAFLRHIQIINCNAYEIVENVYKSQSHVWEPRNVGGAIYATVSLSNHSCYPNIVRHTYPEANVVVRTIRAIKKGDEILDNYGPHFLIQDTIERKEFLLKKYQFVCCCEACKNNWSSNSTVSDITFKCPSCFIPYSFIGKDKKCSGCKLKINLLNIKKQVQESVKQREIAISLMIDKKYKEALNLLLEHNTLIEEFLAPPCLELIKTQQAIIQCYNSMSCRDEFEYI